LPIPALAPVINTVFPGSALIRRSLAIFLACAAASCLPGATRPGLLKWIL
jgi:hypothetical protein